MPWEFWFDSILMGRFKMSRLLSFNDPFDCIGAADGELNPIARSKFIEENYKDGDADFRSKEEFGRAFDLIMPQQVRDADDVRMRINSLCLVLCFVDAQNLPPDSDTLMWSHYGDKGKGVRITFDIPTEGGTYALEKVRYEPQIPVYDLSKAEFYCRGEDFVNVYRQWICTKGTAWSYEHEVRLILHEPDMGTHRIAVNGVEYFSMPREWIKEIAFGSESDLAVARYHTALLLSAGSRLGFFRAVKKRFEYGYEYVNLLDEDPDNG